jgi:hypothetical protein
MGNFWLNEPEGVRGSGHRRSGLGCQERVLRDESQRRRGQVNANNLGLHLRRLGRSSSIDTHFRHGFRAKSALSPSMERM